MSETTLTALSVESLPEYEAVKARFMQTFTPYMDTLRQAAAKAALLEELGKSSLCANPDFMARVADTLGDDFCGAQPATMLSVNPSIPQGS